MNTRFPLLITATLLLFCNIALNQSTRIDNVIQDIDLIDAQKFSSDNYFPVTVHHQTVATTAKVKRLSIAETTNHRNAYKSAGEIILPANPGPANNGGTSGWAIFFDLTAGPNNIDVVQMTTASTAAASATFSIEVFVRSGTGLGGPLASGSGSSSVGWSSLGSVNVTQGSVASGISEIFTIPAISVCAGCTVGVALVFTGAGPRYFGTASPPYSVYSDSNLSMTTGDARSVPFTTTGNYFASRALVGEIGYVNCLTDAGTLSAIPTRICKGSPVDFTSTGIVGTFGYVIFKDGVAIASLASLGEVEEALSSYDPGEYCVYTFAFTETPVCGNFFGLTLEQVIDDCFEGVCYALGDPVCVTVFNVDAGELSTSKDSYTNCEPVEFIHSGFPDIGEYLPLFVLYRNGVLVGWENSDDITPLEALATEAGVYTLYALQGLYNDTDVSDCLSGPGLSIPNALADWEDCLIAQDDFGYCQDWEKVNFTVVQGLPCGWSQNLNGVNCANGNNVGYNQANAVWTVTSTNCYYPNPFNSDQLAFAQQTLCGNGSITAQVTSITAALGWAGVTMRESNMAGAKKAQLMTNLSNFSRREFRTTTGGQAYPQQFPSQNRYWLRITRNGNQFSMHISPNGTNWFFAGAQNISMISCLEVGLVVTNYNANSTVTATFANVTVIGGAPLRPAIQTGEDIFAAADFSIMPNPTNGWIEIDLSSYSQRKVQMELYNLQGKLLRSTNLETGKGKEEIDLTAFANGMYLIRVRAEGLPVMTKRVVLNGNQ